MADSAVSRDDDHARPTLKAGTAGCALIALDAHSGQRSIDEVLREMTETPDDFAARDTIENGVP